MDTGDRGAAGGRLEGPAMTTITEFSQDAVLQAACSGRCRVQAHLGDVAGSGLGPCSNLCCLVCAGGGSDLQFVEETCGAQ